LIHC